MMNRLLAILAMITLGGAAACGDRPDVDFGGRDIGPDRFAIVSEDGAVRLALTDDYLYLALTEETLEDARGEMRSAAEREGAAGVIGGFVERTVGRALQFRALFPLDEVDDIRWEDDALRVEFTNRRRRMDEAFRVGDEPVTNAFDEESVRALRNEFLAVKEERDRRVR